MKVNLTYKKFVPENIVDAFGIELSKRKEISLRIVRDDDEFLHFNGGEYYPVVIQLIETVILGPAVYDITKAAILKLWSFFSERIRKKESQTKKLYIKINHELKDGRSINFEFGTDCASIEDQKVVSDMMNIIKKDVDNLFSEKKNVSDENSIDMKFDSNSGTWIPVDYDKIRKDWDDLQSRIDDLSS